MAKLGLLPGKQWALGRRSRKSFLPKLEAKQWAKAMGAGHWAAGFGQDPNAEVGGGRADTALNIRIPEGVGGPCLRRACLEIVRMVPRHGVARWRLGAGQVDAVEPASAAGVEPWRHRYTGVGGANAQRAAARVGIGGIVDSA